MTLQNVTSMNNTPHHLLFNLHYVDLSQSNGVSVSVHIEIKPLNPSLGYLLIYKFDSLPMLNSSMSQIDQWFLFCPSNLTNNHIYAYFINNQLTNHHKSLIFGLRELNTTEIFHYCSTPSTNPPITNEPFHFTSNYELRLYTSGCYYLDSNNRWQSDGLIVGPLTNVNETECLSTHLTTFAGGFLALPAPVNWNYVFANADFNRNKIIYITVICVSILYLLIMTYAHYKNKTDIEKLGVLALEDNCKKDQYCYQIIVFIGNRKNAGTKSRVHFILAGDEDETQVRTFNHSKRQISQRGQMGSFISTIDEYWNRLENDSPRNLSGYFDDKTNRLIGWFKMIQLRVKSEQYRPWNSTCDYDLRSSNEEKCSFESGWSTVLVEKAFQYTADVYVYDLRSNLSTLRQFSWIDSQTRLIEIQSNLFHPTLNLFTSIKLQTEFHVDSFPFQMMSTVSELVCNIVYLIIIMCLMIELVHSIKRMKIKYFHNVCSYVNMSIIICSWINMIIFALKYQQANIIENFFNETNDYVYIDLDYAIRLDKLFKNFLYLALVLSWIKVVCLCHFYRRNILFVRTFKHAAKDLLSFHHSCS
ncbi:unnamed protein product [Adineta ricciae]|uniref:PLAT domain-containing protein n=1 Tax=Adineta ricciae TaxID=249248 RepID=A0A814RBE9_ADIRI|nr:unnamed protein product [Adineta ricciae]